MKSGRDIHRRIALLHWAFSLEEGGGFVVSRERDHVGFNLEYVKRTPLVAPLVGHAEVKELSPVPKVG